MSAPPRPDPSPDPFGDLHCPYERVAGYLDAVARLLALIRRHPDQTAPTNESAPLGKGAEQ